eukprot:4124376-Pyramimonas_sp.AAC.1
MTVVSSSSNHSTSLPSAAAAAALLLLRLLRACAAGPPIPPLLLFQWSIGCTRHNRYCHGNAVHAMLSHRACWCRLTSSSIERMEDESNRVVLKSLDRSG